MIAEIWLWVNHREIEDTKKLGLEAPSYRYEWSPCYIDENEIAVVWMTESEKLCVTLKSGENYTLKPTRDVVKILEDINKYPLYE